MTSLIKANNNNTNNNNNINSERCPLLNVPDDSDDSDEAVSGTATSKTKAKIKTKLTDTSTDNSSQVTPTNSVSTTSTSTSSPAASWLSAKANATTAAANKLTTPFDNIRDFNKNVLEARKASFNIWQQQLQAQQSPTSTKVAVSSSNSNTAPLKPNNNSKYVTWSWRLLRRKHFFGLLAIALLVLYVNSTLINENEDERIPVLHYSHVPGMKGYLVWSERCKMPNIDPYLPEVMKFFRREKYKACSDKKPLTRLNYDEKAQCYVLTIEESNIQMYSKSGILECSYQAIERNGIGLSADKDVSLSESISFKKNIKIPPTIDNIIVRCSVKKKQLYVNAYAMMPERKELRARLNAWKLKDNKRIKAKPAVEQQQELSRPPSVLLIGIDSISRINLIRAMPKTAQYLYDNEWFEMSGYNKIDDNTFPNLMAVLTGYNKTTVRTKCPPTVPQGLENCSFIWNTFRDHGYVTAYGEDETSINTFNYWKVGFERPPVDYYMRPFLISAENNLHIKKKSNLIYCLGYQHSAAYVYNYALELATRYKNDPFFGMFWTNTFSHNAISDCTAMDAQMVDYLQKFSSIGTMNNTIIVFFSDHGMRFGPTRKTLSGHLEERLPFMFLWLPQHLKQLHPEFVNALSVNKNRLTNPYDLHMTLKHVLAMTQRIENKTLLSHAEDCPRCQTLLQPVPHNRSCDDIAIEDHWCTCIPYQSIYKNSKIVHKLAKLTVAYINDYVSNFRNGSFASKCVPLQFGNVDNAYRAQHFATNSPGSNDSAETYRIIFYTKPNKGLFEATVHYNSANDGFEVTGEISRLNTYSSDSECVEDGGAKKYCSCHKKKLF